MDHGSPEPSLPRQAGRGDGGAAAIETVLALGAVLVVVLIVVNGLLMLWARSVIQHAADVGARAGSRGTVEASACEHAAADTLDGLLGVYRDAVGVSCTRSDELTTAEISAHLHPVIPGLGATWSFTIRSTQTTERPP